MARIEQQEFSVQVNSVFVVTAKDKLEAFSKVVSAINMLKPAGTLSRAIKWAEAKEHNGQPAANNSPKGAQKEKDNGSE